MYNIQRYKYRPNYTKPNFFQILVLFQSSMNFIGNKYTYNINTYNKMDQHNNVFNS